MVPNGNPTTVQLNEDELRSALQESVAVIVATVHDCLERTPPEVADQWDHRILKIATV